jgi:hypothetical protein
MDTVKQQMNSSDSPVMSRAPILLSESLIFPYKRGPQLRAGCVDGPGPGRRLCRRARPPAHVILGDHQPPRIREKARPFRAHPALTSIPSSTPSTSPMTSARSASSTSTSSLKSSAAKAPPATSLLPGTAASIGPASALTQKRRPTGQHQIPRPLLPVFLEKRSIRADLRPPLRR